MPLHIAAASGLIETARRVVSTGMDVADQYNSVANKSLTQNARKCFIESRAYIDKDIEHEKVTPGILKFALTMQATLIIAAFKLDGLVTGGVTVSDKLRLVATESQKNYLDTANLLHNDSIALESIKGTIDAKTRQVENALASKDQIQIDVLKKEIGVLEAQAEYIRSTLKNTITKDVRKDKERKLKDIERELSSKKAKLGSLTSDLQRATNISDSDVTPSTDVNLAVGKVLNITMAGPNGEATIPLFVRINPYMVDSVLVSYMMETAGPTVINGVRTAQLKAGEISFWKDFVFGMDIIKKQEKILRTDKDGEFAEYLRKNNSKDRGRISDIFRKVLEPKNYRTSSNLANAVLVFSEDSIRDGEMRGGLKMDDYTDRQKFFDKSYASMIFVVDANHERVTMYLNGFKDVGHYSYSDFVKKKDLEGEDFMAVLRSVSQGQISRF